MLNKSEPDMGDLIRRCQEEGDRDACYTLLYTKKGYDTGAPQFAPTTVGKKGVVGMAEGGSLLGPDPMMMEEDPFLPFIDILGEDKYMEMMEAMSNFPVVAEVAEMALKTSDGFVEGEGGPKDDKVPARLSAGEFIFSAEAVNVIGLENLERMHEEAKNMAGSML